MEALMVTDTQLRKAHMVTGIYGWGNNHSVS